MTWLLAIELHWECHTGVLPPDALDLPISQESHYTCRITMAAIREE